MLAYKKQNLFTLGLGVFFMTIGFVEASSLSNSSRQIDVGLYQIAIKVVGARLSVQSVDKKSEKKFNQQTIATEGQPQILKLETFKKGSNDFVVLDFLADNEETNKKVELRVSKQCFYVVLFEVGADGQLKTIQKENYRCDVEANANANGRATADTFEASAITAGATKPATAAAATAPTSAVATDTLESTESPSFYYPYRINQKLGRIEWVLANEH